MVELSRDDPRAFKKFLCMPVVEIYDERVRHRIVKQYTWYREPLDSGLKLAATIRHLVSGTKYSDTQYSWWVPENTLSVVVREVCKVMCEEYVDEVMTAPSTTEEWTQLADGFLEKWNFPNCVAAIDGKHVAIIKPCQNSNFPLRKFHTMKNWYQFLTARKKLVPIHHVFHTSISHFVKKTHVVKLYVAYMRIQQIDKIPPKSAAFCIRFQFFTCMPFIL